MNQGRQAGRAGVIDIFLYIPRLLVINFALYSAVLLDLDGTLYREDHPLPGAAALVARLRQQGQRFACLSNSTASPRELTARLAGMGMDIPADHIYTAAAAAADYSVERFATVEHRPQLFNLATEGLQEMLKDHIDWVNPDAEVCDAVIAGAPVNIYATDERRWHALRLLRNGAALIGICADRVYPSPRGIEFGSGALTTMLAYAANVTPIFCGKPEAVFFNELCSRLQVKPGRCLLIGDNLEADIVGAKAFGMATVLVLSGVTRRGDLANLPATRRPDLVLEDLSSL